MQLLLIRHALPVHSPDSSDPVLDELGLRQAQRVPDAVARFGVRRVFSSPQVRAKQTAEPTASKLGVEIDVVDDLAEYDRELPFYMPAEEAKQHETWARLTLGDLPDQIDGPAFKGRVVDAVGDIAAATEHDDTVAVFAHGGVINVYLQDILRNEKSLGFQIDYCSVTRVLFSRTGRRAVAAVNETEHVWDLLPRVMSRR